MIALFILIICMLLLLFIPDDPVPFGGFTYDPAKWEFPAEVYNFLTVKECKKLIKKVEDKFEASKVIGMNGGDRTSETAWLPPDDPIARKILLKACELSGKPYENCEDLQIVRYTPGKFYRPHHDSCCEDTDGCRKFADKHGQRVGTLILYLNDDFEEGHTHFPNLDSKFRTHAGSGLFFRPLDTDHKNCHILALHGGMPPTKGTKYMCNAWVRENKFERPYIIL